MAGLSSKASEDLEILKSTVTSTSALIVQLHRSAVPTIDSTSNNVNALDLAHDAASLIRAHSTKLSLLIINKPFTASAITKILRELISGPLPVLASSVELCNPMRYTKVMSSELQYRAQKTFSELDKLVAAIPLDGRILSDDQKNGTGKEKGNGSLASTGLVWEACDDVIELKKLGVVGLVVRKAEEYRDLLKDALEELQDWAEEESDGEEEDDAAGSSDEEPDAAQAAIDEMFGSQRHIPAADPDKIRPRLESSQKRLRLLILMYQAVVKRRLKTLPDIPLLDSKNSDNGTGTVNCLDELMGVLREIPSITDELANAFYELDNKEIDRRIDQCFFTGFGAVELVVQNWDGQKDGFSNWASKFLIAIKKA